LSHTAHTTPSLHSPSLHDALPICLAIQILWHYGTRIPGLGILGESGAIVREVSLPIERRGNRRDGCARGANPIPFLRPIKEEILDRKSTRLNSSHLGSSYAVFCLK